MTNPTNPTTNPTTSPTTNPPSASVYRDLLIDGDLAGCPYSQIAVYFELEANGPLSPRQLADRLPRTRETVHKALSSLAESDLVEHVGTDGRTTLYDLSDTATLS